MSTSVTIIYKGPTSDAFREGSSIPPIFNANNSYVDTVSYEDTVYDTNVEGWGTLSGLEPIDDATFKFAWFERAIREYFEAFVAGRINAGVAFEVDDADAEIYWEQMGAVMADEGFYTTVGSTEFGVAPDPQIGLAAIPGTESVFETLVSTIQSNVKLSKGAITGTLEYLTAGALPDYWGAGNFIALIFSNVPTGATVKVGLNPSEGSGLVALEPDLEAVFKITDAKKQLLQVDTILDGKTTTQVFDLSGLVCKTN